MLRNKLVSVVVNLWRAHFNFIRYDGLFLVSYYWQANGDKMDRPHSAFMFNIFLF